MTTEPAAPATWLQPFDDRETPQCPKCRSEDLHWEWHATIVIGAHCETVYAEAKIMAVTDAIINSITEHLCRGCLACNYVWCEETADGRR